MGFLDNLKDKAADLVDDVKERFDQDETSEENVEAAADNSPESVAETSQGVEPTDATASTAGLGAVADEPVVAPDDPLDGTPDGAPVVTPDDGLGQVVDGQAGTPNTAYDPMDGTADAGLGTVPEEPVESGFAPDDPVDGTSDRDAPLTR